MIQRYSQQLQHLRELTLPEEHFISDYHRNNQNRNISYSLVNAPQSHRIPPPPPLRSHSICFPTSSSSLVSPIHHNTTNINRSPLPSISGRSIPSQLPLHDKNSTTSHTCVAASSHKSPYQTQGNSNNPSSSYPSSVCQSQDGPDHNCSHDHTPSHTLIPLYSYQKQYDSPLHTSQTSPNGLVTREQITLPPFRGRVSPPSSHITTKGTGLDHPQLIGPPPSPLVQTDTGSGYRLNSQFGAELVSRLSDIEETASQLYYFSNTAKEVVETPNLENLYSLLNRVRFAGDFLEYWYNHLYDQQLHRPALAVQAQSQTHAGFQAQTHVNSQQVPVNQFYTNGYIATPIGVALDNSYHPQLQAVDKSDKNYSRRPFRSRKRNRQSSKEVIRCHECGTTETPEWRRGPDGARTLCNACGIFHSKLAKRQKKLKQPKCFVGAEKMRESVSGSDDNVPNSTPPLISPRTSPL